MSSADLNISRSLPSMVPVLLLKVLGIMGAAEFLVMALLHLTGVSEGVAAFFLDTALLSVLSAPFLYLWVVRSVAERLENEAALAQKNLELELTARARDEKKALTEFAEGIVRNVPSGIMVVSEEARVISVNPALLRIFSTGEECVVSRHIGEVLPFDGVGEVVARVLEGQEGSNNVICRQGGCDDGRYFRVALSAINGNGVAGRRGLVVVDDITERMRHEKEMAHLAHHDALTGLPNRLMIMDRTGQMLYSAKRKELIAAVMFLDLDRFKLINDTLGHDAGDEMLKVVAERLKGSVRPEDTVGRLGGDEFIVLISDIQSLDDVTKISKRIFDAFGESIMLKGHEFSITTSIGIAVFPGDGGDAATLLKNADIAMYRAKAEGRNACRYYSSSMNVRGVEWLRMENKLRKAVETCEEFVLHYQPQIDVATGETVGLEALVRWQDPCLGLIPPGNFIPLAEDTALIVPLGEWILRSACAQAAKWREKGLKRVTVSVNVSMRQFMQEDFVQTVERVIKETGMVSGGLELELVESIIMDNPEATVKKLDALKEMGVRLSIDDFGTGYSSLAYLTAMPIDGLKIAQSFVREIPAEKNDLAIADAIIRMGQSLGLDVIAEGVETREQFDALRALGCRKIQGYIASKPAPADLIEPWLEDGRRLFGASEEKAAATRQRKEGAGERGWLPIPLACGMER